MKRSLVLGCILICVASLAFAQAGSIGVFADPGATDCNFFDFVPGLITVHIVHVHTTGSTGAQFLLAAPVTWIHLGDTWVYPTVIGTSITGVAVAYGGCYPGPNLLGSINFFGNGLESGCVLFGIVADPTAPSGQIEAVDCAVPASKIFPTGGQGIVNPGGPCNCNVPVEDTTWGGVKALYR